MKIWFYSNDYECDLKKKLNLDKYYLLTVDKDVIEQLILTSANDKIETIWNTYYLWCSSLGWTHMSNIIL